MQFESNSYETTLELGTRLATILSNGQVLALYGDLGAGKTVLARGFARGLGITEPVTSPTFTVAQEYHAPNGRWFYHLDMYRIDDERSAMAFGIEEYLFAPDAVTLVEWPERIEKLLRGDNCFSLTLTHVSEDTRYIDIPDVLAEKLLEDGLPSGLRRKA
ncbi:MAG: tRNA (adenosine(37)-N6)-threonylcarbamoyltransferase complex ATPase subunit type 1 TsaE [Victivallales bacterium]|nr:tRNA (adenosine(37)-N6)-threonylcarbamoyltransferase complex ATPase subunit type 1 TsaE [Victivallales bacterium]